MKVKSLEESKENDNVNYKIKNKIIVYDIINISNTVVFNKYF